MSLNGKKVSEFTADAYLNGEFIKVSDKDLQGKWSVLFFYPADFTFVCPTELEDLQRLYDDFKKEGCEIYSVSCDTHFVHKAWHDSSEKIGKVTYPMGEDVKNTSFTFSDEETGAMFSMDTKDPAEADAITYGDKVTVEIIKV